MPLALRSPDWTSCGAQPPRALRPSSLPSSGDPASLRPHQAELVGPTPPVLPSPCELGVPGVPEEGGEFSVLPDAWWLRLCEELWPPQGPDLRWGLAVGATPQGPGTPTQGLGAPPGHLSVRQLWGSVTRGRHERTWWSVHCPGPSPSCPPVRAPSSADRWVVGQERILKRASP
eukprot:bmy_06674T0